MLQQLVLYLIFLLGQEVFLVCTSGEVYDKTFWYDVAREELQRSVDQFATPRETPPKNLVMVIGDGMGVTTTTAARLVKERKMAGSNRASRELSWDRFPYTGMARTYSTDALTPDSAATSTAFSCGVKTKLSVLGLDDTINVGDCAVPEEARVNSVLDWSLAAGKSVGFVTTDALTGATPGALYAHASNRNWQGDAKLNKEMKDAGCVDIASQLVFENTDIQVMLGGGRSVFLGNATRDPEYPNMFGARLDQQNLMQIWENIQTGKGRKNAVVSNNQEFDAVDPDNVDYLLGLFEPERMQEETIRAINNTEPSIVEMVEKAVKILSKNPNGFFLFVEGANIDLGHHFNRPRYAIEETLALDAAVSKIQNLTSPSDTLVVVSADHSHVFSIGGYSSRDESPYGLVRYNGTFGLDLNNQKYTMMSYGNGPGQIVVTSDLTEEDLETDQVYAANFKLEYETHASEDVAIYATGPMAHLFTGTHEQVYLAHAFAYAGCLNGQDELCPNTSGAIFLRPQPVTYVAAFLSLVCLHIYP